MNSKIQSNAFNNNFVASRNRYHVAAGVPPAVEPVRLARRPSRSSRNDFETREYRAFTLVELLVIVAVLFVLTALLAPAIAKSNGQAGRVTCFNNKRQLAVACALYSAEWNDYLVPNAPAGAVFSSGPRIGQPCGWCPGQVDWGSSSYNATEGYYRTNGLGPYLSTIRAYKCPNDRVPSDNGDRIRSVSMNPAIAGDMQRLSPGAYNTMKAYVASPWHVWAKTADLTGLTPAACFYFCDESMYTLNDGYLQPQLTSPGYPDIPAAYDLGGNCFSFCDGHVEYKLWQFRSISPVGGIPMAPYQYARTRYLDGAPNPWPAAPNAQGDGDWLWLRSHTSATF